MQKEELEVSIPKESNKTLAVTLLIIAIVLGLISAYFAYGYFKAEVPAPAFNKVNNTEAPTSPTNNTSTTTANATNISIPSATGSTGGSSGGGGGGGGTGEENCVPNCQVKECGSDGCGGSCGTCGAEEVCDLGTCKNQTLMNIASFAEIKTNLYGPFNKRLVDGVLGKGLIQSYYRYQFEQVNFNQSMDFRFNNSQKIIKIRCTLPPKDYNILADTTGDGVYDTELKNVINGSGGGFWWVEEWPYEEWNGNVNAYAIKLLGRDSLHIMEFEIYSYKDDINPGLLNSSNELEQGVLSIEEGETVSVSGIGPEQEYLKGMYVEDWMLGLTGFINYRKQNPGFEFRNWNNSLAGGTQSYQGALDKLRNMSSNMIWIMPCRAEDTYNGPVMWPSNYINGSSQENYLQMIVDAFHQDGVKVFVGERPYPGWKPKDGLNLTEREMFVGGMAEIAQSGADGVSVCYDELCHFPWYIGAENGDIGKAVAAADAAKAVNPDIYTMTNVQLYNKRSWGFPDLGNMGDIDLLGTEGYFTYDDPYGHWHPAISTKRMIGANPKRGSIITQNVPWTTADNTLFYETFPPVAMYGAVLSSFMHGGDAIAFWRLWLHNHDYNAHIGTGYKMLDTLSSWGGKEAEVPDEILVLHSYNSVSIYARPTGWAYYAIVYLKHLDDWPLEEIRGYVSEEAVLEVLLKNGYPFHYQISDYGNEVTNLSDYKTIIVPFAYYINSTTLAKLEEAVDNGTKLIILGKPETHNNLIDSRNNSVKSTVSSSFDYLINNSNTMVLNDDILHGITPKFEESFLTNLDNALGEDKPTYLNKYGHDIELSSLEKSENEKFLFVTNWENHSVTIDAGINMPDDNYLMLQRDLNETRNISISGKYILTKQDLAKFRVNLEAGEARIFYIYPAGISSISEASSLSIWSWLKSMLTGNTIKSITGDFLSIKS